MTGKELLDALPITFDDMLYELDRELQVRARVFPHWVRTGQVSQEDADRRVARMKAARDEINKIRIAQKPPEEKPM